MNLKRTSSNAINILTIEMQDWNF